MFNIATTRSVWLEVRHRFCFLEGEWAVYRKGRFLGGI
jgi:hypothetical protein